MSENDYSVDELHAQVLRMLATLDPEAPITVRTVLNVEPRNESILTHSIEVLFAATRTMTGSQRLSHHVRKIFPPEPSDKREHLIYEQWRSCAQFRRQWNSEHLIDFQDAVGDVVVPPTEVQFYCDEETEELAPVAKSGLTHCWNTRGAPVDCAGTGQDGEIQAGLASPQPRFVDNGDGTVTDGLTGLVWLQDASAYGRVTWAEALANARALKSDDCGLSDGSQAGDWRIPNIRELRSLIDYSNSVPILPKPNPFENVQSAIYWTSTTLASAPPLAWMTTMGIGPAVFDLKFNRSFMWPVRSGKRPSRVAKSGQTDRWDEQFRRIGGADTRAPGSLQGQDGDLQAGVASPNPRFVDNRDGTVTDRLTNLVWLKNADAFRFKTWDEALSECNKLADGACGLQDGSRKTQWRLPNAKEIESLIDYGRFAPSLPEGHPFTNVRPSSYWTSTTVASAPTQAMFAILGVGPTIFENKGHRFFVWPVRDGQ